MSNFEIVTREDFSEVTYLLEVRHPLMAKAARPGQFVMLTIAREGELARLNEIEQLRKDYAVAQVWDHAEELIKKYGPYPGGTGVLFDGYAPLLSTPYCWTYVHALTRLHGPKPRGEVLMAAIAAGFVSGVSALKKRKVPLPPAGMSKRMGPGSSLCAATKP